MPAFAVTNKDQAYCKLDHSVSVSLQSGGITNSRAEALADTGHNFIVNTNAHSDVGTHTITVTPVSLQGADITPTASFTVEIRDPCEDGYLQVALTNPSGDITQKIGDAAQEI